MPIATINPATGQTLKTFEPHSDSDIEGKLQRADTVFRSYRRTSFAERAGWLSRAASILDSDGDRLARIMTTEMGKTIRASREEIAKCAAGCRYYVEHSEQFLADEVISTNASQSYVRYQPQSPGGYHCPRRSRSSPSYCRNAASIVTNW